MPVLTVPAHLRAQTARRIVAGLCLSAIAGLFLFFGLGIYHDPTARGGVAKIGRPLPPLPVSDETGRVVDLVGLHTGSKTVIVFFSPACRTCQHELSRLEPFPSGLQLAMVNLGGTGSMDLFDRLAKAGALLFQDSEHVHRRLFTMLGIPLVLFVDEDGILRDGLPGGAVGTLLQERLQRFAGSRREGY